MRIPNKRYCDFSVTLVKPRQRSIRINGFATCIRLEEIYWAIIETVARKESVSVGKLLSNWAMELDLTQGDVKNFTGYVRVVCVMQIARNSGSMIADELEELSKNLAKLGTQSDIE